MEPIATTMQQSKPIYPWEHGEQTVLVVAGQLPHENGTDHGHEIGNGDGQAPNIGDVSTQKSQHQLPHRREDAGRDAQESGVEFRVPEPGDDDGSKGDQAAVGDVLGHGEGGQRPRLGIRQTLFDLVPFDLAVFDTRLVVLDAAEADVFFAGTQPPACHGRVGQAEPNDDSPEERIAAEHKKQKAPGSDAGMDEPWLNQNATLMGCSSRVHHITVRMLDTGNMSASDMPMMNRQVAKPPKLCVAAMHIMITPQLNTAPASSLATGSRWINIALGYSSTKWASSRIPMMVAATRGRMIRSIFQSTFRASSFVTSFSVMDGSSPAKNVTATS
ncbi:hypothetical protein KCU88_g268, partial [Aureobasidium melanogenum]